MIAGVWPALISPATQAPAGPGSAEPTAMVRLRPLMERTTGSPEVRIGLVDGPVHAGHPDLAGARLRTVSADEVACARTASDACIHGTFVAGILSARRGSAAPAICPGCAVVVRPIFAEPDPQDGELPSTTPEELARAILDCIDAGARIVNISATLSRVSARGERAVDEALDRAAQRGVLVIAAAGNQGMLGSTVITRHRWVVPVVGYDRQARPTNQSNLGNSIGRRGLGAPGEGVTSLSPDGGTLTLGGTSAAAPFVTGAMALLWSEFPAASALEVKSATGGTRRPTVIPPLLDAWKAYQSMTPRIEHARR
jgi:subtilisin family serine protease